MYSKIIKRIRHSIEGEENIEKRYQKLAREYGYTIQKKKVIFLEEVAKKNKKLREGFFRMASNTTIRHILAMPFIYMMIVPAVIFDIFLTIYHFFAFSFYRIPKVKRSDYIVYERRFLAYLNWFEKVNCLYCSYVNGLMAYSVEICARTERYWCPLKATHHPKFTHSWYDEFADYGNPEEWSQKYHENDKAFCKIKK